jgi:tetrahydromethanopterin:alpha-L-glutamate ligase
MPHSADAIAAKPADARVSVALVIDRPDWHARELTRQLRLLGTRVVPMSLSSCSFDTQSRTGLRIPDFAERLPSAVLVRSVPGGTFEAVTRRLGILHALRASGVIVMNDARAIERCVDKSMTSFLLARAGIRTPATWVVESHDAAAAIVRRQIAHGPLVLKPLFGAQGRGLRLIRAEDDLPDPAPVRGVYYLQRYVGVASDTFRDFRLLVSAGRVVAAMMRHATTWITNIKRGGRPVAAVIDQEMKALAIAATAAVSADFAGVDIVHDPEGRPSVLEVNSMPSWSGLQKISSANIAEVLAADLVTSVQRRGATRHG